MVIIGRSQITNSLNGENLNFNRMNVIFFTIITKYYILRAYFNP